MERAELLSELSGIADQISDLLAANPVRQGRYPLADVLDELATHHRDLRATVAEYPFPLAVDDAGRPDKLVDPLAGLLSYLQHVQIMYHQLDHIPERMRAKANREFTALHLCARRVRDH